MADTEAATPRPISQIAAEIRRAWKKPYFGAVPHLEAMAYLTGPDSTFGSDDAKGIVLRFLSNAGTFRGEDARRLKAELKALYGIK
ncbi:hypothetical protein ACFPC0_10525 [Streptomyces andamanensis]|uniref:Uncharacterized protein n=1 Tax=Streptomyces andamanensis TaxID=1565035 RepID=A0ABV8TCC6_9ACTN